MIDKLVLLSNKEMLILYDNKPAVTLYDSNGDVISLAAWFFSPSLLRLPEYKLRLKADLEDTINQEIAE